MMEVSFGWTAAALACGRKTVTRRAWHPRWAKRFHAGQVCTALTMSRRFGGVPLGTITLIGEPYLASTAAAPGTDYEAEGFAFSALLGLKIDGESPAELWRRWQSHPSQLYVVRFEPLLERDLTDAGKRLRAETLARLDALEHAGTFRPADTRKVTRQVSAD